LDFYPGGPCTLNWHSQDIKSLGDHKVMTQKIPSLTHNLHDTLNYYLIINMIQFYNSTKTSWVGIYNP